MRQPHVHNLTDRTLKMNKIIIGGHSSTMPGVESSIDSQPKLFKHFDFRLALSLKRYG